MVFHALWQRFVTIAAVEDLRRVPGIDEKSLAKICDLITATPLTDDDAEPSSEERKNAEEREREEEKREEEREREEDKRKKP